MRTKLKFDPNRPKNEGDSLVQMHKNNEKTVLLVVPPYQRRKKDLDLLASDLLQAQREGNLDENNYRADMDLIGNLKEIGINSLVEHKRSGQPHWAMQLGFQLKKRGYQVEILDVPQEGWDNERFLFTAEDGSEIYQWGLDLEIVSRKIKEINQN